NDLVVDLPKFKYHKKHLCPSCEQGKSKRASHPPKPVPNSRQRLHLLHMDLCGPMRIANINGKRWSPTGRLFDQEGKLAASSNSKSQYDCSNGDKAYTSNAMEPKIKRFPNSTSLLDRLFRFVYGTVRFGNDHAATILGFGQFCDSDLEVAFRRNACFVRNLEGINLHEMASASPICLMDRTSSTKSWLWNQRLSHLNFDTINDLARNDLVVGLPKFKYHKEHLCPSLLKEYFYTIGISHQMSSVRTPQQNGVMERRNWTLVEAARKMLIFSRAPLFLWAEAIATARFTQNRSIIHRRFNKTPYELINDRKPDISFLHVFGALCYPKNDREDIGKLSAKDKKIMETMNVSFDELSAMAFEQRSSKPELISMTSGHISSGLDLTYAPSTITTQPPSEGELDLFFEAMYDDYIGGQPSATARTVSPAQEPQVRQTSTASTTIADTVPIPKNSSTLAANILITSQDVDELNPNDMVDGNTFVNLFANSSTSTASSSS
nr:hypothetical protein [Tanacetum cinerariifolium]